MYLKTSCPICFTELEFVEGDGDFINAVRCERCSTDVSASDALAALCSALPDDLFEEVVNGRDELIDEMSFDEDFWNQE